MVKNIEVFKNNILFMEIHRNERSEKLDGLINEAEYYMSTLKNYPGDRNVWTRVLKKDPVIYVL